MKNFLLLLLIMVVVVAVAPVVRTQEESKTEVEQPEASKAPRVYPIAAGVWYPGDPLPKEPSRYYRIRCWPGCHSYGEYANKPSVKEPEKTTTPAPAPSPAGTKAD